MYQDSHDSETEAMGAEGRNGLITQPQSNRSLAPSHLAEQSRAITEIQAALTVAKQFPRDEAACLDKILTACQRQGVAEDSSYSYSKGGTDIFGASIRLLEVVAQAWGNISWGFRELAQYPGVNGKPGESLCEAYAWDMESNSKVHRNFTVPHSIKAHNKIKPLTDPREIYELIANFAQRRVRTCLENTIPRDIVDAALAECDKTMKVKTPVTPETIRALVDAFAKLKVTKDQLEAKIQRRVDTITPAQMVNMRKIYKSLTDGMSKPEDWFDVPETGDAKSPMDAAKDKLRKPTAKPATHDEDHQPEAPDDVNQDSEPAESDVDVAPLAGIRALLSACSSKTKVMDLCEKIRVERNLNDDQRGILAAWETEQKKAIDDAKGGKQKEMLPSG